MTGLQVVLDVPLLVRNEGLADLALKSGGLIWGLWRFRSRTVVEVVVPLEMVEEVAMSGEGGKAFLFRAGCQRFLIPGLVLAPRATDSLHNCLGGTVEVEKGAEKLEEPRESHSVDLRLLSLKLGR